MDTFRTIWQGLDWTFLSDIIVSIIPALICITFHETCHGLTAYVLGDPTAKRAGRLSLNPIKHIDWMGLAMMVVFQFGWAKPVPVNMMNFKNPKRGMAVTALAGPLSNILLCAVMLALYGPLYILTATSNGGEFLAVVTRMMGTTAYLSMALAIFNLLPVPPLDGAKVLYSVISDEKYLKLMYYERFGMILMLILVSSGILGNPLSYVTESAFDLLFPIAQTTAEWTAALLWG
ncbi:MAG: site-2 protease family protein [Oscillospiraceae bacterium]|nr:site-2 protease family protein [Oscillospiraceae bacterium]